MRPSFTLLRLRLLQLRRAYTSFGVVVFGVLMLSVPFVVHRILIFDPSLQPYFNGALILGLVGWQQRRADLRFVLKHIERPLANLGLEYLFVAVPIVIGQWGTAGWYQTVGVLLTIPLIIRIPPPRWGRPRLRWLRAWIPADLFEWKAGVQRSYPVPLFLWVLALVFCWLPILPLMLLWGLAVVFTSMQLDCEPRAMLLATGKDAAHVLRRKLFGGWVITSILMLPVLVAATVFQPHLWWVHLFFLLGQLCVVGLSVVLKYRSYVPNERLAGNEALVTTAAVFAVMPGLFLFPLIMLFWERSAALQNLETYFHGDTN